MSKSHVYHSVNLSGLILNPGFPYLDASPNGIVNCLCCGVGYLEIKCPLKYKENLIEDLIFGNCSYLEFDYGGAVKIINTHAYYYQIQTKLLVTKYDYCDFAVMLINYFVCIRIEPDKESFLKISIKCKLFSKPTIANPGKGCYCIMSEEENELIGCGDKNCQIKWFYLKCLRITKIPNGRWFFPECRKAKKQKNNCFFFVAKYL